MTLARVRIEQWAAERTALRAGRVASFRAPGRATPTPKTNRFDAALVRCIDFEREFAKLDQGAQTLLLLAYRERQPRTILARVAACSDRTVTYKIPVALAQLAALLDRANLL